MIIHFAKLYIALFSLFFLVSSLFFVLWLKKGIYYKYSLVSFLKTNAVNYSFVRYFIIFLRFVTLFVLVVLVSKVQFVDRRKPVSVEGIDIIISLDASGSMLCFDDLEDQRSRFEVAKEEAIKFVSKRENDSIGLVIFAKNAVTRCPLTLDKKVLVDIIGDLKVGYIDDRGTALSKALLTSANRLKSSEAKSKVIIFLTDGESNVEDIDISKVIAILDRLKVKVYTVGIGRLEGGFFRHPMGIVQNPTPLNIELLKKIAKETGGEFFLAQNPQDMEDIYNRIDELEKTTHTSTIYSSYEDFFIPLVFVSLALIFTELLVSTFVWFML